MKFASIEQFKERAQFFPKGRIIPARILKVVRGKKKHAYCVTFNSDSWAMPVNGAYVLACDARHEGSAIRLRDPLTLATKEVIFRGSPYSKDATAWLGNFGVTDAEWLKSINTELAFRELMK